MKKEPDIASLTAISITIIWIIVSYDTETVSWLTNRQQTSAPAPLEWKKARKKMLYEKLNILFQIEAVEITRWYSFHTLAPVLFTIYLQMKFDMAYSAIK